jgi:hypothetical protein
MTVKIVKSAAMLVLLITGLFTLYPDTISSGSITVTYPAGALKQYALFHHEQAAFPSLLVSSNREVPVSISAGLSEDQLANIILRGPASMEVVADEEHNSVAFTHIYGEAVIDTHNTYFSTRTVFGNTVIDNYVSRYTLISLPGNHMYVRVEEGKIGINRKKSSMILIAGEAVLVEGDRVELVDLLSVELARNRLYSKMSVDRGWIISSLQHRRDLEKSKLTDRQPDIVRSLSGTSSPPDNVLVKMKGLQVIKNTLLGECFIKAVLDGDDYADGMRAATLENSDTWEWIILHSKWYRYRD